MKRKDRKPDLKNIPTQINEAHTEDHDPATDKGQRYITGKINVRGSVETQFPKDLVDEYKSGEEQKNSREKIKIFLEILTFFSAVIILYFTGCQTITNRKSLQVLRDQFATDQRPYIWIALPVFHDPSIQDGVTGNIKYENFGKSPALHINTEIQQAFFGPNALDQADKMFASVDNNIVTFHNIPTPPLMPFHADNMETILNNDVPGPLRNERFLQSEINWINANPRGVIMAGRVIYEDMAGNKYTTDWCIVRAENEHEPRPCARHNEVH